jgi:hypothetical protein
MFMIQWSRLFSTQALSHGLEMLSSAVQMRYQGRATPQFSAPPLKPDLRRPKTFGWWPGLLYGAVPKQRDLPPRVCGSAIVGEIWRLLMVGASALTSKWRQRPSRLKGTEAGVSVHEVGECYRGETPFRSTSSVKSNHWDGYIKGLPEEYPFSPFHKCGLHFNKQLQSNFIFF